MCDECFEKKVIRVKSEILVQLLAEIFFLRLIANLLIASYLISICNSGLGDKYNFYTQLKNAKITINSLYICMNS